MQSICVYCGSSPGARPVYAAAAEQLATELVTRGLALVYGGAAKGIMGRIADAVLEQGGTVIGVIPQQLVEREIAHPGLTELHVVSSMHERKAMMAELADGFVAMPGGLGTLEEIIETLTWAQLGLHGKPCGLLNVDGYYDRLLAFLDSAVTEGFVRDVHRGMLLVEAQPAALLSLFSSYAPVAMPKWRD